MEEEPMNEGQEKKPPKSNVIIWVIIVAVIVIIGIVYFSRGGNRTTTPPPNPSSGSGTQSLPQQNSTQPSQTTIPASPQQNATQVNTVAVTVQNFAFSPADLKIKKGDIVTWTNKDSVPHQIASDTGKFQGPAISNGQTYSFTFNETGTFPYHCTIHPMMKATITVE